MKDKPQFDFYLNDEIYPELCDNHIMDVSKKIQDYLQEFKDEKLVSLAYITVSKVYVIMFQKYKSVETVSQFSDCVNSMKRVVKKKEATTSYLQMLTLFMHDISLPERVDYRKCEEGMYLLSLFH